MLCCSFYFCSNFNHRIVERSNLAALEFIMSKQPRGKVRIGAGNTAGVRTADIFDEVEKFQARYAQHKASKNYSKVISLSISLLISYSYSLNSFDLKLVKFEAISPRNASNVVIDFSFDFLTFNVIHSTTSHVFLD